MQVPYFPKRLLLIIVLATGLLSVSFQMPKTSKVEIKNIGLSKDESAKIMLTLEEDDDLRINIRNRGKENELKDTETEFKLWKTGEETSLLTGNIGNKVYKYICPAKGSYILEVMTKRKKEQFCHISLEKVAGTWSGDKPAVTIKSTLLEPPSKGLDNKLRITYPVAQNINVSIAGEGKNAGAITLEIPSLDIRTSLDKGFQQKEKLTKDLDVYLYLDEDNLKDRDWFDRIIGRNKKAAYNINKFCEIKVNSPEKKQENTSESPLAGKSSGLQAFSASSTIEKTSEGVDIKTILEQQKLDREKEYEQQKQFYERLMKNNNEKRLIKLPSAIKEYTLDLANQFDFTLPVSKEKRKCIEIKINDIGSQYYAYWVGISDIFERYKKDENELKQNYPGQSPAPTLLSVYSNGMYFQKARRDAVHNEILYPLAINTDKDIIDDVELAIVDEANKSLFESGQAYSYIKKGLLSTTGQMFGFSPFLNSTLYLCGCNKNKLTSVTIKAKFEAYTTPESDL